ncbi:MAG: hypothetical protein EB078_12215 [Proteobacteria bacterium]|nr:hypothetical protein [Pseudomonadota bacterium]NDC24949.1 hypothetical protein [Pseudomonadota bacterium]NDD05663.1 hypothetical protein [Pseudomonadota bacterium]NDG27035.1 hypothetical protein [Pseudomonadota bacterium]
MLSLKTILRHAFKIRCPRCGVGKLFLAYGELVETCGECRLPIRTREPDTYFFMYMSTAAITGTFVISMLMLAPPKNQTIGSLLIGLSAIAIFFITTPLRKSISIAWEYYTDAKSENPRFPG